MKFSRKFKNAIDEQILIKFIKLKSKLGEIKDIQCKLLKL